MMEECNQLYQQPTQRDIIWVAFGDVIYMYDNQAAMHCTAWQKYAISSDEKKHIQDKFKSAVQ